MARDTPSPLVFNFDALDVAVRKRLEMIETARQLRRRETPSEKRLWSALRGRKLCGVKFRRQHPIGPFVVDFFAAAAGIIVEIDGGVHERQLEDDAERQRLIERAGYRFVRFSTGDVVANLDGVLRTLRDALDQALTPVRSDSRAGPPLGCPSLVEEW